MSSKVELILEILCDGEWHSIYELQQLSELIESTVQNLASFLKDFDFVTMDFEKNLRINQFFKELMIKA
jgi:hypothetical protein